MSRGLGQIRDELKERRTQRVEMSGDGSHIKSKVSHPFSGCLSLLLRFVTLYHWLVEDYAIGLFVLGPGYKVRKHILVHEWVQRRAYGRSPFCLHPPSPFSIRRSRLTIENGTDKPRSAMFVMRGDSILNPDSNWLVSRLAC